MFSFVDRLSSVDIHSCVYMFSYVDMFCFVDMFSFVDWFPGESTYKQRGGWSVLWCNGKVTVLMTTNYLVGMISITSQGMYSLFPPTVRDI